MNRINIFGIHVNETNLQDSLDRIMSAELSGSSSYACFPDVSVIVAAQEDENLKTILNSSLFTFPDGKPLALYARIKGFKKVDSVSGYWLIKKLLSEKKSHFFYGSDKQTLEKLKKNVEHEFPNSNVLGYKSPPQLEISNIQFNSDIESDIECINKLRPDLVWIGISSPKQDYLMHYLNEKIQSGLMLGVGGVFDYLAGTKKISPEWIKKISMRWLYRLFQEPGRLWKRYMFSILKFLFLVLKDSLNLFNKSK